MSKRWWFPFEGLEEMSFKRVPEGYLYRAPNRWLIGRGRYYLLNEQQKSEIAAYHRRSAQYLAIAMVLVIGVGVVMAGPWFDTYPLATLAGAALVGLAVGFAFNAWLAQAVRPLLAGLEPTTQRITRREAIVHQVDVFSTRTIMFYGLLSLVLFVLTVTTALLTSTGWTTMSLVGALLFGAGTIYWMALYIAKRRRSAV